MNTKFNIELKEARQDAVKYEFLLDDSFFAEIEGSDIQRGTIRSTVTVKKTSGAFELVFHIDGNVIVPCDRCLDDMTVPVENSGLIKVKFGAAYSDEGNDLIIVPESDGFINVAWLLYEFIELAVPITHAHEEGACNEQMLNILKSHSASFEGEGEEGAQTDEEGETPAKVDPRWEDLKKLLNNN